MFFDFDETVRSKVNSLPGCAYSATHSCFYVDDNEANMKLIINKLKEVAEVDISSLSLPSARKDPGISEKPSEPESDTEEYDEMLEGVSGQVTIRKVTGEKESGSRYGPVSFSINEPDGRLIIRFLGRYDQDWIREVRTYGKVFFDKMRNEWYLRWSQITVDSLADYFMERGVKIRIERTMPSRHIREKRESQGAGIRDRILDGGTIEAIDAVRRYLEENRYSPKTVEAYTSMLSLFFKYYINYYPGEITESDISDFFHDYVIAHEYSPSFQNQMVSAIKLFFSLNGNGKVNVAGLARPRHGRSLPKVFSKEEVVRILNSPRNIKHKLMLWMIYSCGLRRSEVTNIRLRDLDRDRGILSIIEAKGMVDRIVPVPPKVWARLDEYLESCSPVYYLFEGQGGGRYSSESVYRIFKDALKKAGIEKEVGVHSLRHSYATHLHENGLDIRYIQELLGHKDSRTTEIYTHVSRRSLAVVRSPIEDLDVK